MSSSKKRSKTSSSEGNSGSGVSGTSSTTSANLAAAASATTVDNNKASNQASQGAKNRLLLLERQAGISYKQMVDSFSVAAAKNKFEEPRMDASAKTEFMEWFVTTMNGAFSHLAPHVNAKNSALDPETLFSALCNYLLAQLQRPLSSKWKDAFDKSKVTEYGNLVFTLSDRVADGTCLAMIEPGIEIQRSVSRMILDTNPCIYSQVMDVLKIQRINPENILCTAFMRSISDVAWTSMTTRKFLFFENDTESGEDSDHNKKLTEALMPIHSHVKGFKELLNKSTDKKTIPAIKNAFTSSVILGVLMNAIATMEILLTHEDFESVISLFLPPKKNLYASLNNKRKRIGKKHLPNAQPKNDEEEDPQDEEGGGEEEGSEDDDEEKTPAEQPPPQSNGKKSKTTATVADASASASAAAAAAAASKDSSTPQHAINRIKGKHNMLGWNSFPSIIVKNTNDFHENPLGELLKSKAHQEWYQSHLSDICDEAAKFIANSLSVTASYPHCLQKKHQQTCIKVATFNKSISFILDALFHVCNILNESSDLLEVSGFNPNAPITPGSKGNPQQGEDGEDSSASNKLKVTKARFRYTCKIFAGMLNASIDPDSDAFNDLKQVSDYADMFRALKKICSTDLDSAKSPEIFEKGFKEVFKTLEPSFASYIAAPQQQIINSYVNLTIKKFRRRKEKIAQAEEKRKKKKAAAAAETTSGSKKRSRPSSDSEEDGDEDLQNIGGDFYDDEDFAPSQTRDALHSYIYWQIGLVLAASGAFASGKKGGSAASNASNE